VFSATLRRLRALTMPDVFADHSAYDRQRAGLVVALLCAIPSSSSKGRPFRHPRPGAAPSPSRVPATCTERPASLGGRHRPPALHVSVSIHSRCRTRICAAAGLRYSHDCNRPWANQLRADKLRPLTAGAPAVIYTANIGFWLHPSRDIAHAQLPPLDRGGVRGAGLEMKPLPDASSTSPHARVGGVAPCDPPGTLEPRITTASRRASKVCPDGLSSPRPSPAEDPARRARLGGGYG